MIRAGFAADKENAVCLYKTSEDGQLCGGIMLAGIGTKPMAGAICDDAVQRVVDFAAYYLQKTIDLLLDKSCADTEYAANLIFHQLSKLNDNISYITRHIGQGVYLSGVACYVAAERFICLPFGGVHSYLWDNEQILPLMVMPENNNEPHPYIWGTLGGTVTFNTMIFKGCLLVGHQLLFMTQQPPEHLLNGIMSELIHTNQVVVPVSVYKGLERGQMPLAVLNIAQAANLRKGAPSNDGNPTA